MKLHVSTLGLGLLLLLLVACTASTEASAGRKLMQDAPLPEGSADSADSDSSMGMEPGMQDMPMPQQGEVAVPSGEDAGLSQGDDFAVPSGEDAGLSQEDDIAVPSSEDAGLPPQSETTGESPAADADASVDQALTSGDAAALTAAAQAAQSSGDTAGVQATVASNLQDSSSSSSTLTAIESAPEDGSYTSEFGVSDLPSGGVSSSAVDARLAAMKKAVDTSSPIAAVATAGRKLLQFSSAFLYRIFAQAQAAAICAAPQQQGGNLLRGITSNNRAFATATARGIKFAADNCCNSATRAVYEALVQALNSGSAELFVARMNFFKNRLGISSCGW